MGSLYITEYIYDKGSCITNGKTVEMFDIVSSCTVAPEEDYSVNRFTVRLSCNQENEQCLDQTNLLSDGTYTYSLNGSITGSVTPSITIGGEFSYTTSTSGLKIVNSFSRKKEKDWKVEPKHKIKGNAIKLEPGIRVINTDNAYMSGAGSYFSRNFTMGK